MKVCLVWEIAGLSTYLLSHSLKKSIVDYTVIGYRLIINFSS